MSSVNSPSYALAGFLQTVLKLLAEHSESSARNSDYFIQTSKQTKLQDSSFDVISLFTNVPVKETLQIIKTKLETEWERIQQFNRKTVVIMDLPEVYLKTTFFQVEDKFCEQKALALH